MTDTGVRRSLALRSGSGSSSLRPNVPGYIDFNAEAGGYLGTTRAALTTPVVTLEFVIKIKFDSLGQTGSFGAWGPSGGTRFAYVSNNQITIMGIGPTGQLIGNGPSTVAMAGGFLLQPFWIRAKLTVATAGCEYWYSTDPTDNYDLVGTWTQFGTGPVIGTNAGMAIPLAPSADLRVASSIAPAANVYAFYEIINGVKTAWFVSTDIPAGGVTSFNAAGGGSTWSLVSVPPTAFIPAQNFQGALRSDFTYTPDLLGLEDDDILGLYGINHESARISYQPTLIPPHPTLGWFQEAMVVRSTAGFPATNLDGAMVMRHLSNDPVLGGGMASVVDGNLIGQQWYYYALFVRYDTTSGWFKVAEQSMLNPAQYGYPERLWRGMPNYYRRIDQGIWIYPGYLRRICNALGYEFDVLRSYAATVGDVWDFEKISAKLLPEAGAALGLVKQSANGDRRLRTLVGNIMTLRKQKGTKDGTEGYVSAQTGWPTRVYEGLNLLHRTQHAEWPYSFTAGNNSGVANTDNNPGWSSRYGGTNYGILSRQIAAAGEGNAAPIAMPDGSFYLRITNDTGAVSTMHMTYGSDHSANGTAGVHSMIPVVAGHDYKFTVAIKASASTTFTLRVDWYTERGVPNLSSAIITNFVTVGTTWVRTGSANTLNAPGGTKYAHVRLFANTAMAVNATVNIFKPMFVDLAWRPEGIPTLKSNPPLSNNLAADLGTFTHQDYYESPRQVMVNVYPMRTNLALNSDFTLNNVPPGAWASYDSPTYSQLPVAYSSYADIVDAEPGDSETTYLDMAQGLAPLIGSLPSVTFDTTLGRLVANKPTAPYGFTIMHTFFPATDLGGMSAAVQAYTDTVPSPDRAYLSPTVSTVTTPDPGTLPPNDSVLIFRVRGPLTATEGSIASQMGGGALDGWEVRRGYTLGTFFPDRLAYIDAEVGQANGAFFIDHVAGVQPTAQDEYLAMSMSFNPANNQRRLTVYRSADGDTWTALPSRLWQQLGPTKDSPDVLRIGGTTAGSGIFNGRIYWVEMRTGLDPTAGSVLWRFDASEYPGVGTSFTDPRGRVWTMSNAGAITRPNPGTRMTMAFEWYTNSNLINRINVPPDAPGVGGVPLRTQSPNYVLTTSPTRYEVVNAIPPANALYGRLMLIFSNTVAFNVYLNWALIEDAPYPEYYFNGDWPDGDDGDFFYATGKGYTGAAHQSPSVYYQQYRHFASGVSGSDTLSQLMPYLLPFRRPFKVITAGTTPIGLYNAVP